MNNRIAHTAEARSVNRADRTIDVVASTNALDSFNTRIDPNGWELEQFRKNPVITWAHDDRGFTASGGRPIAKAENTRVEDGKLKMRLRFPQQGKFPFADECFELMADGFLNAVSVGFDPVEYRDEQTESDGNVRVYTRQKLLEVAVVTIPSNDEALVERARRQNIDVEEARARIERLELMAKQETEEREIGNVKIQVRVMDLPEVDAVLADVQKHGAYFAKKQPANRAATKVLEKFYKRVLNEEPPADEEAAWNKMGEAVDAMQETTPEISTEPQPEPKTEEVVEAAETPAPVTEETPAPEPEATPEIQGEPLDKPSTDSPVEAPPAERKAFVQVSLSDLTKLGANLSRNFADVGVEALRRGIPAKEVGQLIDGAKASVSNSLSLLPHGNNS